jgi:hypothetical protein
MKAKERMPTGGEGQSQAAPREEATQAATPSDRMRVKVLLGVRGAERDYEVGEVVEVSPEEGRLLGPHVQLTEEPLT